MRSKPSVSIWVDGSTYPTNPGNGGWGAVLEFTGKRTFSRAEACLVIPGDNVSNNQAEISAITGALRLLKTPCIVTVYSDSIYAINGALRVMEDNPFSSNTSFWKEFMGVLMAGQHEITFVHVKGHAGNKNNERAHDLAYEAAKNKENLFVRQDQEIPPETGSAD